MNVNFGLFPELEPGSIVKPEGVKRFRGKDKTDNHETPARCCSAEALRDCATWLNGGEVILETVTDHYR